MASHMSAAEEKDRLRQAEEASNTASSSYAAGPLEHDANDLPPSYTEAVAELEAPGDASSRSIPQSSAPPATTSSADVPVTYRRSFTPSDVKEKGRPRSLSSSSSSSSSSSASSSSSSSSDSDSHVNFSNFGTAAAGVDRFPTRNSESGRLDKVIAIPTTRKKLTAPFIRAYPPILESYGIPQDIFFDKLDKLNRTKAGAPPLALLGMAGGIVGFVPEQTAQIVSAGVQVGASLGNAAISKGRTELFLRDLNAEIFKPRGLKAEIAKLDALAKIAGIDPLLDERGKMDKDSHVLGHMDNPESARTTSVIQRRIDALAPWIARLEFAQQPAEANKNSNWYQKWIARDGAKKDQKTERRLLKNRMKAHRKHEKRDVGNRMERLDQREARIRERFANEPYRMERKIAKLDRKRAKVTRKHEKKDRKGKKGKETQYRDKEDKMIRKITFLIIRDLDADSGPGENPVV